jgi:hypothetical protein
MQRIFIYVLIGFFWLGIRQGEAQTLKMQKEIERKLEQARQAAKKKAAAAEQASLETLIAEALKNNPDIRVAEAKLHEAEAELQRMRLKIASDIACVHAEIQAAKVALEQATAHFARLKTLLVAKGISHEDYIEAQQSVLKQKSAVALIEARLPYLLGKQSSAQDQRFLSSLNILQSALDQSKTISSDEEFLRRLSQDIQGRPPTPQETKDFLSLPAKERREQWLEQLLKNEVLKNEQPAQYFFRVARKIPMHREIFDNDKAVEFSSDGTINFSKRADFFSTYDKSDLPMIEKLRKALDTPVRLDVGSLSPGEVLGYVRDKMLPGVNLHMRLKSFKKEAIDVKLTEQLPVGAVLQYLEDELEIVFILRDYGVIVVAADERLPPGAVRVIDFWKRGKAAETKSDPKEKR